MRVLVSISSCQQYEASGLNDPLRETWLADLPAGWDYRFFHGRGAAAKQDIVVLPVDDGLGGLTEKAKAKARWAVDNGYEFVFSCFPDTYAAVERLVACGFESCDYLGMVFQFPGGAPFCQGGPGYFLSRKSCEYIAGNTQSYLNDDTFIGDTLNRSDIKRVDTRHFANLGAGPLRSNLVVTSHLSTRGHAPTAEDMREEHKRWLAS